MFEALTLIFLLPFQTIFAQLDYEASNDYARPNARVSWFNMIILGMNV